MSRRNNGGQGVIRNYFIFFKGDDIIKINKGETFVTVTKLLGEPLDTIRKDNSRFKTLVYKLKGGNLKDSFYELHFIDDYLEWALKTNKKR